MTWARCNSCSGGRLTLGVAGARIALVRLQGFLQRRDYHRVDMN